MATQQSINSAITSAAISSDPLQGSEQTLEARPGDYIALLKPRVMSLVVFTGLVGLWLAPGQVHPVIGFVAILCIAIAAGASGAINMWYDADIDAIMMRTRNRPIPAGRVAASDALTIGVMLSVGSVTVMALAVNWAAAALLAGTIAFYVFVYTMWLKRRTPQNIVIGGAAGAFPPMVGWAAATGSVSLESIALFAIIFMWTPPHFWALALYRSGDYERAGVPMLPVVAGLPETRRQIMIYSVLLMPVTLLPWYMGMSGAFYGASTAIMGVLFVGLAGLILKEGDGPNANKWAKSLFAYSIFYLFMMFVLLVADRFVMNWIA
jgi:heme o synthase